MRLNHLLFCSIFLFLTGCIPLSVRRIGRFNGHIDNRTSLPNKDLYWEVSGEVQVPIRGLHLGGSASRTYSSDRAISKVQDDGSFKTRALILPSTLRGDYSKSLGFYVNSYTQFDGLEDYQGYVKRSLRLPFYSSHLTFLGEKAKQLTLIEKPLQLKGWYDAYEAAKEIKQWIPTRRAGSRFNPYFKVEYKLYVKDEQRIYMLGHLMARLNLETLAQSYETKTIPLFNLVPTNYTGLRQKTTVSFCFGKTSDYFLLYEKDDPIAFDSIQSSLVIDFSNRFPSDTLVAQIEEKYWQTTMDYALRENDYDLVRRILREGKQTLLDTDFCDYAFYRRAKSSKMVLLFLEEGADTTVGFDKLSHYPHVFLDGYRREPKEESLKNFEAMWDRGLRSDEALFPILRMAPTRLVLKVLQEGVSPNITDNYGKTLLMTAVLANRVEAVRLLLQHPELDLTINDTWGKTVFNLINRTDINSEIKRLVEEKKVELEGNQ